MSRIAIIGAGIGGLTLGQALASQHDVVVFEKGRGVGGRMATRYADGFAFDHGAQYFTVRDPRFAALVQPLIASGAVAPWEGKIARIAGDGMMSTADPHDIHYVGMPNMNSLAKALAANVSVRTGVDVAPLGARQGEGWVLSDIDGVALGVFDWVISTTTPHQTVALFADHAPADGPLRRATMLPCYALMLGFGRAIERPWVLARVADSAIELVALNSSKPGRDASKGTLVAHSTSAWAAAHLGDDPADIQTALERAVAAAIWLDPATARFRTAHRWKSARLRQDNSEPPFVDRARGLAASGDWTTGSRVENVVLSALDLAAAIGASK
ncbi:NAD(P)-binding protein [Devosia sp. BSSL-BM10]|uniref:NAD(P)-binding protein n=1 Tax=Devosia litorisediminis TaxID=2829817 RepID=A0A942I5M3_9HYPH|nr:NAD(P)-binding protein [Devosia litorisediminis]MBS3847733.1 NAD(P)-binding protein [Devosia litorisediminis]